MIVFILCASVCMMTLTSAFPSGASPQACSTMTPIHRSAVPQPLEDSPYTVEVTRTAMLNRFTVTVSSNGTPFRGLMLQARASIDGDSLGTWDTPNDVNFRLLECHGNAAGTMTHANRIDKNAPAEFIWTAPSSVIPVNYVIYATVVRELETFYVRMPSFPILGLPTPPPRPPVVVPTEPVKPDVQSTKGTIDDTTGDIEDTTGDIEDTTDDADDTTDDADDTETPGQAAVAIKSSIGLAVLLVTVVQWFRRFFV